MLCVLLGAIAFSLGGLFVKLIPWQPLSISSGRCIFSSLVIFLYIKASKHPFRFNKTVLIGGLCVSLMLLCYVTSIKLTTAANAIVLEYTAPVFILLFEWILFKKKPGKAAILVSVLVFLGILIVVSDGLGKGNLKGDLIALLSGVFYAFTIMLNDFDEADPLSSFWIGHFLTMLVGLPSLLGEADHSASTLLLVMILGIFQAGAGYTLLTVGLKTCDPLSASLIASIEPVLNPILVAIFYKEYIGPRALIGAFIVIVSIAAYNFLSMQKDNV